MINFLFYLFLFTYTSSITYASYNHEHSDKFLKNNTIRKNHSLPIINLDKDPALKEYYHNNEEKIPTSRSNVVETGVNGEELLGFLAFIRDYDSPSENNNRTTHKKFKVKDKKKKRIKRKRIFVIQRRKKSEEIDIRHRR